MLALRRAARPGGGKWREPEDGGFGTSSCPPRVEYNPWHPKRSVLVKQDAARMADGDLLQRYLERRDEAAFEDLVRGHGPMRSGKNAAFTSGIRKAAR